MSTSTILAEVIDVRVVVRLESELEVNEDGIGVIVPGEYSRITARVVEC